MAEETRIEWADHIDPNATGRMLGAYKSAAAKVGCSLQQWLDRRMLGEKWCFRCRQWKPGAMFSLDASRGGGRSSSCKSCTSEASTASRYKMSRNEMAKFRANRGHCCEICNSKRNVVIDHDHKTGRVRGLLCTNCNSAIGKFKESRPLFLKAIDYLEKHGHG